MRTPLILLLVLALTGCESLNLTTDQKARLLEIGRKAALEAIATTLEQDAKGARALAEKGP